MWICPFSVQSVPRGDEGAAAEAAGKSANAEKNAKAKGSEADTGAGTETGGNSDAENAEAVYEDIGGGDEGDENG